MNKEAGDILKDARNRMELTQDQMAKKLAERLGHSYSSRAYQMLEDGEFPKFKSKIAKELDAILGTNLFEVVYEKKFHIDEDERKVGQSESEDISRDMLKVLIESNRELIESNRELVQNNRVLAESTKTLSDAHLIIAKTHDELFQLTKRITAGGVQETPEAVQTKLTKILGYIAQIGSGRQPWKSLDEAFAVLNSEFVESQQAPSPGKAGIPSE